MNQNQQIKQKKSRRPYRRSTASIGDILLAKANNGDKDAKKAAATLIYKRRINNYQN